VSGSPKFTSPSRRLRRALVLLALLAGLVIGGYYLFRPAPPPIPEIDWSDADPEVVQAIIAARDAVARAPRDAAAWGRLGMLLRAHDFEMPCVQAFQAAERFDPTNPKWPYLQGLTRILFDPAGGLACLQRAAARAPADRPEPHQRLAEALLEQGQIDAAEQAAQVVVQRYPRDSRAGLILARVAAERGDWAAVLSRTEPFRTDPTARKRAALLRADAYRRLGQEAMANAEVELANSIAKDESWTDVYVQEVLALQVGGEVDLRRGIALLEAGQAAEAVVAFELAASKLRNPLRAQLLQARALNQCGNPGAALRLLTTVLQSEPAAVEGWFQLGVSQFLLGNPRAAVDSFEQVVKLKPDHVLGHTNLGQALSKLGNRAAAEAAFEAALRCRPDYEPARKALAELRAVK
jgi:tetratricopeptide (TPR) repeat protein